VRLKQCGMAQLLWFNVEWSCRGKVSSNLTVSLRALNRELCPSPEGLWDVKGN